MSRVKDNMNNRVVSTAVNYTGARAISCSGSARIFNLIVGRDEGRRAENGLSAERMVWYELNARA